MINYIRADLRRSYRRLPRLIILALIYIVAAIAFVQTLNADGKVAFLTMIFETYVIGYVPLVIGLLELAVVLSDDFRAKTMQSAIGMGLSRRKVVIVKLIDLAILMLVDLLIFAAIILATSGIMNAGMNGTIIRELMLTVFVTWLKYVAYTSLVLIVGFSTQNVLFAILAHLLLASGLAQKGLNMALQTKALAALHLDRFLLTTQANAFYTQMLLGRFQIGAFIAVLIYIVAGVVITSYLYSSLELEL